MMNESLRSGSFLLLCNRSDDKLTAGDYSCIVNKEKIFKKALQRFLIDNVFYTVDEFLNYDVNNI